MGPIKPGRGLRKSEPLSPYLFIICAEGLSSILRWQNRRGLLHGSVVRRRAPSVSHLIFADDNLLFYRATREECITLKSSLDLYERASGQAINYSKSSIFFSANTNNEAWEDIKNILGVHASINTNNYLNLPSMIGRSKSKIFKYIRDRLWNRLQGWRKKKLSNAGKEVIIKEAAQAIPAYCMGTFLLSDSFLDDPHRMLNSFW